MILRKGKARGKKITKIEAVSKSRPMDTMPVKRVCAYCRVSTGTAEQKNSFEAQVQYYTRLIDEKDGWVCTGIYADEARSGTKVAHREEFQHMMQDCAWAKSIWSSQSPSAGLQGIP